MHPFWHRRRVFVTGHTGFKGGWLSLWLQHLGAIVTGFALTPEHSQGIFVGADVAQGMTSLIGDVTDLERLSSALREAEPEVVFHFAAQALVRASYEDPVGSFATNVMGTVHLLEAIRTVPTVRSVVVVTSDKCYAPRRDEIASSEGDRLGGDDPYSSSKACAELVVHAYRHSFFSNAGPRVATVRAGNVVGGGDWGRDRLVPDIVRAMQSRSEISIRYPGAVRPWQFVLEPLSGYLALAERLFDRGDSAFCDAWNFGPQRADMRPVRELVEVVGSVAGQPVKFVVSSGNHLPENPSLYLDSEKARRLLGWRSRLGLVKTLDWTMEWYARARDAPEGALRALSISQIERYQQLAEDPADPGGGEL